VRLAIEAHAVKLAFVDLFCWSLADWAGGHLASSFGNQR
jgi:hypothetical protein